MPYIEDKPIKMDFSRYFSVETIGRKRSALKELRPYFEIPGMISFGVGIPHPSTFPINGMTISLPFVQKSVFIPGYESLTPESMAPLVEYTPPNKTEPLQPDLADSLQYSATFGAKHLTRYLRESVDRIHNPKYADWDILLTAGNTDGTDAVLRAFFNRGDSMLVEEFAYPGLLSPAATLGINCVGVPMDSDGVKPDAMDQIMSTWDEARQGAKPKVILMVPTCSNPCGMTMSAQRKKEIYRLAQKWELLIVEDDPYCFLQIRPNGADSPIVPTFISLDTDGRVIRIDSFSKIVAPGSRLGYISAHKVLLEKMMNTRESATQCPSGFSVAAIAATLRAWGGHEGFENKYVPYISDIYAKRCLNIISLLKQYVPASTIDIPEGSGGMFLWVRLKIESHPDFPSKTPEEIQAQVFQTMISEKILCVPSMYFRAPSDKVLTPEETARNSFLRISFALPPPDEMEEGVKRMARSFAKEWQIEI